MPELLKRKFRNQSVRLSPILAKSSFDFFSNQLKNPVFVLGCARSGTTLLAELLGDHRDIANWSEANYIWDPEWYPWRPSIQGIWPMEFDTGAFTARWSKQAFARQKEIQATFGAYQWLQKRDCFLNKSPFHTFRISQLLKMFPGARLIHLIRDGRAVAHSYTGHLLRKNKLQEWPAEQREIFSQNPEELTLFLASFWKKNIEEVVHQDRMFELTKQGKLFTLSYEDLCNDTNTTLNHICGYLKLDPERFMARKREIDNCNHKWKSSLKPALVSKMVSAMEPALTECGYK